MAELTGTVTAEFSAGHVVENHPRCGRPHGHRWRVAVTISAGQDPKTGELLGLPELAEAVEQFARELDRETIVDMLPGAQPTPAGVGLALRERLSLRWHSITEVTVWMDSIAVTVHV